MWELPGDQGAGAAVELHSGVDSHGGEVDYCKDYLPTRFPVKW